VGAAVGPGPAGEAAEGAVGDVAEDGVAVLAEALHPALAVVGVGDDEAAGVGELGELTAAVVLVLDDIADAGTSNQLGLGTSEDTTLVVVSPAQSAVGVADRGEVAFAVAALVVGVGDDAAIGVGDGAGAV